MLDGLKTFILKGNVVNLAVGVVIGVAFNELVSSLTEGLITPLIGFFGGTPDFSDFSLTVNNSTFLVGAVLNALISFLIVASVVYFFVVLPMNTLMAQLDAGKEVVPTQKKCPHCLGSVPIKAKKCMYCTSSLSPQ